MITTEEELQTTKERIEQFQKWLAQIRRTARPQEFAAMASGYRLEIERMQSEVLDYLLRPMAAHPEPQAA